MRRILITLGAAIALLLAGVLGTTPASAEIPAGVTGYVTPLFCSGSNQAFNWDFNNASTEAVVIEMFVNGVFVNESVDYPAGSNNSGTSTIQQLTPGTPYTISVRVNGEAFGSDVTGNAPSCVVVPTFTAYVSSIYCFENNPVFDWELWNTTETTHTASIKLADGTVVVPEASYAPNGRQTATFNLLTIRDVGDPVTIVVYVDGVEYGTSVVGTVLACGNVRPTPTPSPTEPTPTPTTPTPTPTPKPTPTPTVEPSAPLASQTLKAPAKVLKKGKKAKLAKATRQGAKVKWKVKGKGKTCKVKASVLFAGKKKGACRLTATAPAVPSFKAFAGKFTVKVK